MGNVVQYGGATIAKNNINLADSVGIDVTWFGPPCENPKNSWVSPPQDYPLMLSSGSGCSLGRDQSTLYADS